MLYISLEYPIPGWLQTYVPDRPALINAKNGMQDYLHHMVFHHPVLKASFKRSFQQMLLDPMPSGERKLGDAFAGFFNIAREILIEAFPGVVPSVENVTLVAVMTQAAVYSPYFTYEEVTDEVHGLGIQFPFKVNEGKHIWWLEALSNQIPHVLPAEDQSLCKSELDRIYRCLGGDRAIHFSQHLALAYVLEYCRHNKLQDANRIPNFSKIQMMVFPPIDELQVFLMDQTGGVFWEILETQKQNAGDAGLDERGIVIPTGFYDPLVVNDLIANGYGAGMGILLARKNIAMQDIQTIISAMNAMQFAHVSSL